MTANFDIDRLGEKVNNARVAEVDSDEVKDDHLKKFFSPTELGVIEHPSTVVDEHGRVILWYLPDILAPFRAVSVIFCHTFICVSKYSIGCI